MPVHLHTSYLISLLILLLVSLNIQQSLTKMIQGPPVPKRPNLYRWLAQNSYICDPTLLNKRSHRFLTPRESSTLRCSCGDPLVTKKACGRKNRRTKEKPSCFRLPEPCFREYAVIFANGGNRLTKPLPHRTKPKPPKTKTLIVKKKVARKRTPRIVTTIPVTAFLRVRKAKIP
ncbi:hypothetical protein CRE_05179 [Caenorhabditis remanei]|uniref:Uncharacterized protein n=1 Tax=Caenorhabditis remanei TaxID=31234 RepID=E3NAU2_CAERE|nr:hypothetical protein CRE_05179 [Caenorhabditis remanei]